MKKQSKENKLTALSNNGYYYHIGTENTSFLKTAQELKEKNVINNKFMLALYDEKLAYINPFDNKLSKEIKSRILIEITSNPWYFWREILLVPVPGGEIRFRLHLGNLAILWAMCSNLKFYNFFYVK